MSDGPDTARHENIVFFLRYAAFEICPCTKLPAACTVISDITVVHSTSSMMTIMCL